MSNFVSELFPKYVSLNCLDGKLSRSLRHRESKYETVLLEAPQTESLNSEFGDIKKSCHYKLERKRGWKGVGGGGEGLGDNAGYPDLVALTVTCALYKTV